MAQPDTAEHKETQGLGNTKRARNWCFTLNNYTEECIQRVLDTVNTRYVFQEEQGKEGTKHLQGYMYFKNARKFDQVKSLLDKAHWEVCRDKKASIEYCQKEDTRIGRVWIKDCKKVAILKDPIVRPLSKWQQEIVDMLDTEPDDRKINWVVDYTGGKGKTSLCKHICMKYNAIYVSGKSADIKFGVSKVIEEKGEIKVVCIDLTRSIEAYVSYQAIEEVKNGIFYNTKYESGMCIFNTPHVFVFSNFDPDEDKLSSDRWNITRI